MSLRRNGGFVLQLIFTIVACGVSWPRQHRHHGMLVSSFQTPYRLSRSTTKHNERTISSNLFVYKEDGSESLVSHVALDHDYILPASPLTSKKPPTAPEPSESTTGIHSAFRKCPQTGSIVDEEPPVMVKTSQDHDAIVREVKHVQKVQAHAKCDDVVVAIYDHNLVASDDDSSRLQEPIVLDTNKDAVIVMERGEQDLLAYLSEHYEELIQQEGSSASNTITMPKMVTSIARSIEAAHTAGLIWTDVKLTNFVITPKNTPDDSSNTPSIKAIDLESCVAPGSHPRKFTPSSCPPEMSPVLKGMAYMDGMEEVPRHPTDYSFDIWSLGLLVFTLVTNQSFHPRGLEFGIMARRLDLLDQAQVDVRVAQATDNGSLAQDFIRQCLQVNPSDRPTIQDLLHHPFLATN